MRSGAVLKVMVVAGGSGGHVFPAIGFCQELKEAAQGSVDIVFVTTPVFKTVPPIFNPFFLDINRSVLGLLKLGCLSVSCLMRMRPDVVFGFGGYISVPFLMGAKILGKKTLLHEQNVVPGRANKFLAAWVDKVAITFFETREYLKRYDKKIFLSRYPLRKSLVRVSRPEALQFFGFSENYFTILVTGGSQGAHRVNDCVVQALKLSKNLDRIQIIHLCGRYDLRDVMKTYETLPVRAKVYDFLSDMQYAYSAADLVISRSGAGSVMEIARFGLPSILVPYPLAGAHQVANATVLAKLGAALLLEDAKMSPNMLNGLLDIFVDDAMRRKTMGSIAASFDARSQNLTLSDLVMS